MRKFFDLHIFHRSLMTHKVGRVIHFIRGHLFRYIYISKIYRTRHIELYKSPFLINLVFLIETKRKNTEFIS